MKPKRVDPLTGMLNFLCSQAKSLSDPQGAFERNRATATKTELGDITIDTCCPSDTNTYETGIQRMSIEGKWIIVEQYEDKEQAELGHKKWVNIMEEYPDYPLKDIDTWSLDDNS